MTFLKRERWKQFLDKYVVTRTRVDLPGLATTRLDIGVFYGFCLSNCPNYGGCAPFITEDEFPEAVRGSLAGTEACAALQGNWRNEVRHLKNRNTLVPLETSIHT